MRCAILPAKCKENMFYLLLSVGCTVMLGFLFKLFVRYSVDIFQAIVVNYITCVACGWVQLGHFPISAESFHSPWMPCAVLLGLVFISGFNTAAMTVRHFGVTVSQIMQKMSILISVPFAIFAYQESAGWGKVAGFLLALAAIVLVNLPGKGGVNKPDAPFNRLWWIPAVTWVLSGILESVFVIVQHEKLANLSDPAFIIAVFGTAGVIGLVMAVAGLMQRRLKFHWKNLLGGVLLGIPNYGSMLFLLRALGAGLEGSLAFPVSNVGVIVITAIGAVTLFRERLSLPNWLGVALAAIAILLIAFI